MKANFDNSIKVLVNAYLKDELVHWDCRRCAVGNLVSAACGFGRPFQAGWEFGWLNKCNEFVQVGWIEVFCAQPFGGQELNPQEYHNNTNAKYQIDATGYTWQELAQIESAFEFGGREHEDPMYGGLMSVVDILAEIHSIDLQQKEAAKALFTH